MVSGNKHQLPRPLPSSHLGGPLRGYLVKEFRVGLAEGWFEGVGLNVVAGI